MVYITCEHQMSNWTKTFQHITDIPQWTADNHQVERLSDEQQRLQLGLPRVLEYSSTTWVIFYYSSTR